MKTDFFFFYVNYKESKDSDYRIARGWYYVSDDMPEPYGPFKTYEAAERASYREKSLEVIK